MTETYKNTKFLTRRSKRDREEGKTNKQQQQKKEAETEIVQNSIPKQSYLLFHCV